MRRKSKEVDQNQRKETTHAIDAKEESSFNSVTKDSCKIGVLPIVPVKIKAKNKEIITYAMLDSCSTGTFIR